MIKEMVASQGPASVNVENHAEAATLMNKGQSHRVDGKEDPGRILRGSVSSCWL